MTKYDLIAFGATGFTGSLVVQYLHDVAAKRDGTRWAVGGRSAEKLAAVLKERGAEEIDIVIADSKDEASLRAMVKQTKAVISLVGPYSLYGELLVKVCAEEGVHYCDLTGEAPFAYKMIKTYEKTALGSKAILVHSTGFDSIPSDLTTFLAVERLNSIPGAKCGSVKAAFSAKGGASGGTIASGLNLFNFGTPEDFKVLSNPFCLSPVAGNHTPRNVFISKSTFRSKTTFGGFFVMAPHNSAIVRRTWGLLEQQESSSASTPTAYGKDFRYEEVMKAGGFFSAGLLSLMLYVGFAAIALLPPVRALVGKYGPQPGEGPSVEVQQSGWFKCETTATSTDERNQVRVIMKGNNDPGYSGTARFIVECGLALAHDHERLPALAQAGGFLTPATAFGHVLVERLEKTGTFEFELQSDKKE